MRNCFLVFIVVLICIFCVKANAFPETISTFKAQLSLVGKARFNVLFWDIYDSSLYSPSGTYQPNDTYLFEITYLREIEKQDLLARTKEQWQHIGLDSKVYREYLPQLETLWPNIRKGDSLAIYVSRTGSAFYFNQNFIGEITDPQFGDHFVAIWLSPQTSQPKLRSQLLGEQG